MKPLLDEKTIELVEALYNKDINQLNDAIVDGASINTFVDSNNLTPLHYAVILNFCDGVRLLLEAGANIVAKTDLNTRSQTPKTIAKLFEYYTLEQLLDKYLLQQKTTIIKTNTTINTMKGDKKTMNGTLILSRRIGKSIMIGDDIKITALGIKRNKIRLAFNAPRDITIHRLEIYEKIQQEKKTETTALKNKDLQDE